MTVDPVLIDFIVTISLLLLDYLAIYNILSMIYYILPRTIINSYWKVKLNDRWMLLIHFDPILLKPSLQLRQFNERPKQVLHGNSQARQLL